MNDKYSRLVYHVAKRNVYKSAACGASYADIDLDDDQLSQDVTSMIKILCYQMQIDHYTEKATRKS